MGSVSLSLTPPSDPTFPSSNPLRRRPSLSLDLVSSVRPPPATESEHKSTESAVAAADPMHGFKTGDLVWGSVKQHPWWPGQIYNEACAVPSVHLNKVTGHVLVAFFGNGTYAWFDPSDLLPFEPHFRDFSTQEGSPSFVNAVNDAIYEVNRRAALGLACCCCSTFRPIKVPGYVTVDMPGFEPGDYSMDQIEEARRSIRPAEVLSIASELAVMPRRKEVVSVERSRRKATLFAYRRAVFRKERAQPKNLSIRDGGKTKKKRRHLKLRHQLPTSEDNNLKLSDLFATGTHLVVAQISGSQASSHAMPLMVSEFQLSQLLADLRALAVNLFYQEVPDAPAIVKHVFGRFRSMVYRKSFEHQPVQDVHLHPSVAESVTGTLPVVAQISRSPASSCAMPLMASELQLSQPLAVLRALAVNPFYQEVRYAPAIVKHIFGRFRSMVYRKSFGHQPVGDVHLLPSVAESATGTLPVVAQISGSPASSHEMPHMVSESQLSRPLADLHALAVNLFYEEVSNAPAIAKYVFGRFRSMVYRKSLDHQPSIEVHLPPSVAESETSLVPLRALPKAADCLSTDRERAESDRFEELSDKRIKRLEMVKAVTKPKPSQQLGGEKDVVELKLKQKLGSTKKKVVNSLPQQAELQPMSSDSQLSQPLANLRALAVDFLYEEVRNAPAIVKDVFGKFRSMVYRKSFKYQPLGDVHPAPSVETSLVPIRALPKAVDCPGTNRKRAESDKFEELSAKRIKRPKILTAVTKPKPSQQLGSEKDVVELKLMQKLGSTKKKVVNSLPEQAELQPMSSESAAVRVVAELPNKIAHKTMIEKSGIVRVAALPLRQPAELQPVKKVAGYVAGETESATKGDAMQTAELVKKADDKGTTTMVESPAIHPSELNAARNVQHAPELLPRQLLPPPPTQTYRGIGRLT